MATHVGMYWTQGLHRAVQQKPDGLATIFGERKRTFREQADRVARLAGALRRLGVRDGVRVGILALNSDRYAELLLAIPWADGSSMRSTSCVARSRSRPATTGQLVSSGPAFARSLLLLASTAGRFEDAVGR